MFHATKSEDNFAVLVHQRIGEISNDGNWSKQLTVTEWGYNNPPKFDIRMWDAMDEDRKRSTKGITMTLDEMKSLKEILENFDFENFVMPDKKLIKTFEIV